jgi:hypothetical protein
MDYLSFRNWKQHQHYTDRKPPWIKLHTNFHEATAHLSNDARLLACLLFCVAANKDNRIPNDPYWLSVEVGMPKARVKRGIDDLMADSMLVPWSDSSSDYDDSDDSDIASSVDGGNARLSHAPAYSLETETETEKKELTSAVKKERKPNLIAKALAAGYGAAPGDLLSKGEWARIHRAAKELKEMGVDAGEVERRVSVYRKEWSAMTYSPQAVTGNWTKLGELADRSAAPAAFYPGWLSEIDPSLADVCYEFPSEQVYSTKPAFWDFEVATDGISPDRLRSLLTMRGSK